MKPFGYWRDPVCLIACGLYALNRFWLRARVGGDFLIGYFNDLLLLPAALPWVLWVQRKLRVRAHDRYPGWGEILLHLIVWAVIAEAVLPRFASSAVADWADVVAYSVGAAFAGIGWTSANEL
jgi:hypothetical protein